jgi:poly(3-hydroxybutyrate) depolymerase
MVRRTLFVLVCAASASVPVAATVAHADPGPDALWGVPCDILSDPGEPLERGFNCRTIEVQGFPRIYVVYVPRDPDFRLNRKAPLVLGQHGSGGRGGSFLLSSGWAVRAERDGILLAFGTALEASVTAEDGNVETRWNAYGQSEQIDLSLKPPGYPDTADWPADDVGFVEAIIDDVEDSAKVDRDRVFATGFSNGAAFSARLGIEASDRIAAVAGFAGSLVEIADVPEPIPYLLVWGADDHHVTVNGTPVPMHPSQWGPHTFWLTTIAATSQSWGAGGPPDRIVAGPPATMLAWDLAEADLRIALVDGLGHEYPSGAPKLAWRFFEDHPK